MSIFEQGMSEEEYKQSVYSNLFKKFDYAPNWGKSKIDFVLRDKKDSDRHLLWAEAKKDSTTHLMMLTQLILTIKSTFTKGEVIPPNYLATFNSEGIELYTTEDFVDLLSRSDIDWRVTPSNYSDSKFIMLHDTIGRMDFRRIVWKFNSNDGLSLLKKFINEQLIDGDTYLPIDITISNLNHVFNEWVDLVKPEIELSADDWKKWRGVGLYESDFFLADAYVDDEHDTGYTLAESLKVLIGVNRKGLISYSIKTKTVSSQISFDAEEYKNIQFNDMGMAYRNFWAKYKRPPRKEIRGMEKQGETPWEQILLRRDILVPKDIMERKGAFFTPRIWVEKAHEYIADALGDDWQDEYYVYDCAAGSGNLLSGLYNQERIFASDIDGQNVRIMMEETRPTFRSNIFQFDFLNDDYVRLSDGGKVPDSLMDVLEVEEKRRKLIFLINPPYAESMNRLETSKGDTTEVLAKEGVNDSLIEQRYSAFIGGKATRELSAQFLARIYGEFNGCILADFSKLKFMQSPNFKKMREWFKPKLLACFLAPADTFDNVDGQFPIGFKVWNTSQEELFESTVADSYDKNGEFEGNKNIFAPSGGSINSWLKDYVIKDGVEIAGLCTLGTDFGHQSFVNLASNIDVLKGVGNAKGITKYRVTVDNIINTVIYFSVRWSEDKTVVNDRDQFMSPHTNPLDDEDFINDCLIYTVLHSNNNISIAKGDNHWIPFSENDVCVRSSPFAYKTMLNIFKGRNIPVVLSHEAKAVYDVGLEIFKYYHSFSGRMSACGKFQYNHNAALYDIRQYFQSTSDKGNMKVKSDDSYYQELNEKLRLMRKKLRDNRISPKVYEYGFLV